MNLKDYYEKAISELDKKNDEFEREFSWESEDYSFSAKIDPTGLLISEGSNMVTVPFEDLDQIVQWYLALKQKAGE